MGNGTPRWQVLVLAVVTAAAIFAVDLKIPLGVAAGVPYVTVVLITLWSRRRRDTLIFAILCSVLILLGYLLSSAGGVEWMVVANRGLALFVTWTSALLVFQKKNADAVLTESELRFRQIAENSEQVFWLTDWKAKKLLYVSPAYQKIFGRSCKSLYEDQRSWIEAVHPEDKSRVDEAFSRRGMRGQYTEAEYRIVLPGGSVRWIRDRSIPVCDEAGAVDRWVGVAEDITARVQAQKALRQTMDELENRVIERTEQLSQAKKAAEVASNAKSEFLANMSHEIRTPMTAILGFTDNLFDADMSESDRNNCIHTIRRNGRNLLGIINDILDLSKIEAGKMTVERATCEPCRIVAEVVSLARVQAEAKGVSWSIEYAGAIPETIQSDPMRLRQILINLIGNAIKFTEAGSVRLVTRLVNDGQEPQLQFDVIDTGRGMTREHVIRLFQRFTQADTSTTRKYGGTGLGLTISKRLAAMLGGDISVVETREDAGSTFRVTVATGSLDGVRMLEDPLSVTVISDPASGHAQLSASDLLGSRILLVEDGPDNQRLISAILKKVGAEVSIKENGKLALEAALAARDAGNPYDVILMDMQMPVMDGYEATTLLRRKNYTGLIIALTAHAMVGDREKCLQAGCDDHATKPIDRKKLIETIQAHLHPVSA